MASKSSNEGRKDPKEENPEPGRACTETLLRPNIGRCFFCQKGLLVKRILRLAIKKCFVYVTLLLVRLSIFDGVVTVHSKKTVNFIKVGNDRGAFYPTREDRTRRHYLPRRGTFKKISEEGRGGILEPFINRLVKSLEINARFVNESIDHVMTNNEEVLFDINLLNLTRLSSRTEKEIENIIINMFWKPKSWRNGSANGDDGDDDWFRAVDHGQVVPFYTKSSASCFRTPNIARDLFGRCIHEIEERTVNAFSWYFEENLSRDSVFPRFTLSYAQYAIYEKTRKIFNPKVIVVEDNPLDLGTHFAHVTTLHFYSHHKYVRKYMRDVGVFFDSIIRINKNIPFVVRSLDPITRMHMFHMVYKRTNYSRPSYEDVFKVLVMLRNAMIRLGLKDIAMSKIGCCRERLNFAKVLRMIEYIFFNTDINVRIGLNLTRCWHFRSQSSSNQVKPLELFDLSEKRIDRYFSCDASIGIERLLNRASDVE